MSQPWGPFKGARGHIPSRQMIPRSEMMIGESTFKTSALIQCRIYPEAETERQQSWFYLTVDMVLSHGK